MNDIVRSDRLWTILIKLHGRTRRAACDLRPPWYICQRILYNEFKGALALLEYPPFCDRLHEVCLDLNCTFYRLNPGVQDEDMPYADRGFWGYHEGSLGYNDNTLAQISEALDVWPFSPEEEEARSADYGGSIEAFRKLLVNIAGAAYLDKFRQLAAKKSLNNRKSCEKVREALRAKVVREEPYTTQERLAKEVGCSPATVKKAVEGDTILRRWKRETRRKRIPRTESLDFTTPENPDAPSYLKTIPQEHEPIPGDDAMNDVIIEHLRDSDRLTLEYKARLHKMPDTEQRKLADECRNAGGDWDATARERLKSHCNSAQD